MASTTFFIIILAAILHAGWNAVVKGGEDKLLQMTAVMSGHIPFAVVTLFFVPALDFACWPNLMLGAIFHFGFKGGPLNSTKTASIPSALVPLIKPNTRIN